jgi:ketosteroid isomerase-like protein
MIKRTVFIISFALTLSAPIVGQNTNSSNPVRPRTTASNSNARPSESQRATDTQKPKPASLTPRTAQNKPRVVANEAPGSASVLAAFNALLAGIRHADVNAVASVYSNSPRLVLFNNNGTVTKGWEQMRKNRESSYRDLKDVKLDVHDLSVVMLGRDGAVVSCLWIQSQAYKGTPETASGRMTLVFKRVGKDWKAVHLHTSPDKQDQSRVLPSEQTPPSPTPTSKP